MAGVKKSKPVTTGDIIHPDVKLPQSGMVDIIFKGKVKNVSAQLAKTLIDKGSATLNV